MMNTKKEDEDDLGGGGGGGGGGVPIPSGQYVKLVHTVAQDNSAAGNADDKNKILNLAELEVFGKGGTTSLAAGKDCNWDFISGWLPRCQPCGW